MEFFILQIAVYFLKEEKLEMSKLNCVNKNMFLIPLQVSPLLKMLCPLWLYKLRSKTEPAWNMQQSQS